MTTVLTIPQTAFSVGPGTITTPSIATASKGYVLTIQQVGWPHAGGQAMQLLLMVSYNNGATFQFLTSDTIQDEAMPAVKTFPADSFRVAASLNPEVGGLARILRLDYVFAKALSISGKVDSI